MNLTDISPFLIYKFKSEAELVKSIHKLSDNFTHARDDIEDYHSSEKLISAYAAFYLTTNFPKFAHCMSYLKEYDFLFRDYEIIDIGVGPGTFLFAIGEYFNWKLDTIYGIETSHLMKKQALKIKDGLFQNKKIEIVSNAQLIPAKTRKRLVIFTHSFNEMGKDLAKSYIRDLDADGVMFIEPGTKSLFKDYLQLRSTLIAKGFNCHYPCPSNSSCPLEDKDDWCHQYVKITHDLEVARLTQVVSKNRTWQPMTLGLYLKDEKLHVKKISKTSSRIVRTYPETKFSFQWEICMPDHSIRFVEVMKKDYSKANSKVISKLLAGAEVDFDIQKEMELKTRIKLRGFE
jgi:ribosomal protein RSM22 (predicted rRNA methylase)